MAQRVGFQLDIESKKSTDELRKLELRLQNINRYLAAAKKAGDGDTYKSLRTQQLQLREEAKKLNTELKRGNTELGQLVDRFRIGGVSVGDFKAGLQNTQKAMGLLTKSTNTMSAAARVLKVALASTGIGLLIIALGSLVAYLTQTQQGMNLVARAGNAIKAVIDVLIERAAKFGEGLVSIFSGNLREGFSQLGESIKGIGSDITGSVKEMDKLTKSTQDLVKVRRELEVETAKVRAREKELSKIAEDTSLSPKARAEAAAEGIRIEEALFKKREALILKEIEIQKGLNELSITTDADKQKVADLEVELNNARTESIERITTLNGKLNTSNQAMSKLGTVLEKITEGSMNDLNMKLQALNKEISGGGLEGNALRDKIKEIIDLEGQLAAFEAKVFGLKEELTRGSTSVTGTLIDDPNNRGFAGGIDPLSSLTAEDPVVSSAKKQNEKLAELDAERAEAEAEALELKKQMIEDSYGALGEISGQYISGEIKSFQDFAKAAGGIFFDLAAAQVESLLAPILARLTANLGVPAGPIASAAIIGVIKGVLKGAKSKLEDGGILNEGFVAKGPRHAHGGIPIGNGQEIEGGEPVLTRRAAQLFPNAINAINMASGGRRILAQGGILGGGSPVFSQSFFGGSNAGSLSDESIEKIAAAVYRGAASGLQESVRARERQDELITRNVA